MKKKIDKDKIIRMYKKGLSFNVIQNLAGCQSAIASKIIKEAGLFNPNRQRDYFNEQNKNKRVN